MKIGVNAMSTISAMRDDFEGTIKRLKDGGCDYLEVMSDWGAKQETIDFYAGLTNGSSGWDPDLIPGKSEKELPQIRFSGVYASAPFSHASSCLPRKPAAVWMSLASRSGETDAFSPSPPPPCSRGCRTRNTWPGSDRGRAGSSGISGA